MALDNWIVYAFASAIFAALTAVLGKIGVQSINSNFATFVRTVVILLFIAGIVTWQRQWTSPSEWKLRSILFLVLSGLATGASWLCYYRALQLGPVSKVAPIDKMSVALAIVLAVVFLGEKLDLKTVVGGLLVIAGSVVLALG